MAVNERQGAGAGTVPCQIRVLNSCLGQPAQVGPFICPSRTAPGVTSSLEATAVSYKEHEIYPRSWNVLHVPDAQAWADRARS